MSCSQPMKGEGIRWLRSALGFGGLGCSPPAGGDARAPMGEKPSPPPVVISLRLCAFALVFPFPLGAYHAQGCALAGIAVVAMVCSVTLMPAHLSLG